MNFPSKSASKKLTDKEKKIGKYNLQFKNYCHTACKCQLDETSAGKKEEEMRQIYYYILGNDTKLVKVSQSFPSHKEAVCEGDCEELQIGHMDI